MSSFLSTLAHKPSNTLKVTGMTEQLPAARDINQVCSQQASYDREFAKALKVFYQSMNMARGQFLRLRLYKPPVSNQNPGSKRSFFPLNLAIWYNCIACAWGRVYLSRRACGATVWVYCSLRPPSTCALAFSSSGHLPGSKQPWPLQGWHSFTLWYTEYPRNARSVYRYKTKQI